MDKESQTATERKKDYSAPRLTEFGSLRELTQGAPGNPEDPIEGSAPD